MGDERLKKFWVQVPIWIESSNSGRVPKVETAIVGFKRAGPRSKPFDTWLVKV